MNTSEIKKRLQLTAKETWFPAPSWVNYGKKIRDGTFSGKTGFKIDGGMKDAAFIRRLGAETSTPTPIIDQAWSHLTTAKALGGDGLDWSSCSAGMRVTAGLPPFKGEDFSIRKSEKATDEAETSGSKVPPADGLVNGDSIKSATNPNGSVHNELSNGDSTSTAVT